MEHTFFMHKHLKDKKANGNTQYGFPNSKLCLTNTAVFCDKTTSSAGKGAVVDMTYHDSSKASDTNPHSILIWKLRRRGPDAQTARWAEN